MAKYNCIPELGWLRWLFIHNTKTDNNSTLCYLQNHNNISLR